MSRAFNNTGPSQFVEAAPSASLNNLTKITVGAWVNFSNLPTGGEPPISAKDPTGVYQWALFAFAAKPVWGVGLSAAAYHWPNDPSSPGPKHSYNSASGEFASPTPTAGDLMVVSVHWSNYDAADTLTVTDDDGNVWTTITVVGKQGKAGHGIAWAIAKHSVLINIATSIPAPNRTYYQTYFSSFNPVQVGTTIQNPGSWDVDVVLSQIPSVPTNSMQGPELTGMRQDGDLCFTFITDITAAHTAVEQFIGNPIPGGFEALLFSPILVARQGPDNTFLTTTGIPYFAGFITDGVPDDDWIATSLAFRAVYIPDGNKVGFGFQDVGGGRALFAPILGGQGVPLNGWHHVAATFDSTGGTLVPELYVDGVLQFNQASTTSSGIEPDDSAGGWYVGGDTFNDYLTKSFVMEYRVYNTVLTQPQIAAMMESTKPNVPSAVAANLVMYLHMCGTQNPEPDSSTHNNNAAVTGATLGPNGPVSACGFVKFGVICSQPMKSPGIKKHR